jgi:hypothetical protein
MIASSREMFAPMSLPWAAYESYPRPRIRVSQVRATRAAVQSPSASGVLKPKPGIDGMTTWKASSARPPWATGSVSGPTRSRKSTNEPG